MGCESPSHYATEQVSIPLRETPLVVQTEEGRPQQAVRAVAGQTQLAVNE